MQFDKYIFPVSNLGNELVVMFKEPKSTSVKQVNFFFDYLESIVESRYFHLVIDLSDAAPPNAEVRAEIRERIKNIDPQIISYQIFYMTILIN